MAVVLAFERMQGEFSFSVKIREMSIEWIEGRWMYQVVPHV